MCMVATVMLVFRCIRGYDLPFHAILIEISRYIGRFVAGLGIGLSSALTPVFISEISPASHRGMLVTFNQISMTGTFCVARVGSL